MEIGCSISEAGLHTMGIGKNLFIMAVKAELEFAETEDTLKFGGEGGAQEEFILAAMHLVTLVAFSLAHRAVFVQTLLYLFGYLFVAGKT